MTKVLVTILFFGLTFSACRKSDSSSSGGYDILSSDQKNEAAKIVESANEDLKKVRSIYKANQNRVDQELIPAITGKDIVKAKEIANDLVNQINDGLGSADDAVKKIKEAEDMDINSTYKEYLKLKREALEKQIEAFYLRHKVAKVLRDSLGSNDAAKINQAQKEFQEKEVQFRDLIEKGTALSEEANQIFKDSLKQK